MRAHQGQYPVATVCRVLGVSTSGHYAWRQRPPSRRAQRDQELSARIHEQSRQTYGARRVHAELRAQGERVPRRRVARLMRALGVQWVTRRKRWSTACRDRRAQVAPDRVQRQFEAGRPDQLWVAGITYVPAGEGFVFLAMVLDVCSRRIVGWAMGARQTAGLVQAALAMAAESRGTPV